MMSCDCSNIFLNGIDIKATWIKERILFLGFFFSLKFKSDYLLVKLFRNL